MRLVMVQPSAKSELERYVGGLILSLRIQAAKRPEEWLRWGGLFVSIQLFVWVGPVPGLVAFLASFFGAITLAQRRLGQGDPTKVSGGLLLETAPRSVQRELRKGTFDAKVGPECRALLEESARTANTVLMTATDAANAVVGIVPDADLLKFKPLTEASESLMKSALARIQFSTLMGRAPDEDTVEELKKIEANLRVVLAEAKRLGRQLAPPSAAPEVLDAIQARKELDET